MNPKVLHASRILRKISPEKKNKARTTKTRCKHKEDNTRKHKLHTILQYTNTHERSSDTVIEEKQPPCNCKLVVYQRNDESKRGNIESATSAKQIGEARETWGFEIGFAVSYALKGNKRGQGKKFARIFHAWLFDRENFKNVWCSFPFALFWTEFLHISSKSNF